MEFITLLDIPTDELIQIEQSEIDEANRYVERVLFQKGIPLTPELQDNMHLKDLAKTYAIYRAFLKRYSATGNENEYGIKLKHYEKLLKDIENSITKETLEITSETTSVFGTFKIGRG
ncbi:MAG: hypothetical protein GXO21_05295 [Aquificae bacterium]|nr:hypothetical protein [Aquificota bacterium]